MNRMEEYAAMLRQLDAVPASTQTCVDRAKARRNRSRMLWRPLVSVAAVFALFVGTVNLSPSVAAACREIPLLEQLVEALTFSPSLQRAVENDYIQPMGLEQTVQDITVRVEHVIVDQKQVNIFYAVDSAVYEDMTAAAEVLDGETGERPHASIGYDANVVTKGELRQITVDYKEETVPAQLRLLVKVNKLAEFDFLLTFDPKFTAQGKTVTVGQTMNLDGNLFTVTTMEIYPSHIRINIEEDLENEAWLNRLWFYLELEDGTRIDPISNGITAFGNPDTPSMTTYNAESSYFYTAEWFRLVVTGADFREKDFEDVRIDLETGETGILPPEVTFLSSHKTDGGVWEVKFLVKKDRPRAQAFLKIVDEAGTDLDYGRFSSTEHLFETDTGVEQSEETYYLQTGGGTEAWFTPNYTDFWLPDAPVTVEITTS